MSKKISLDGYESVISASITDYRRTKNRADGRVDQLANYKDMSAEELEWHSYGAELAAARVLNLFPDFSIELTGGLGAPDLILRDGRTADVKWSKNAGPFLNVYSGKAREETREDIYIYVSGRMPDYEVVGWATKEEVFRDENLTEGPYNRSKFWRVRKNKLHPVEELL